MQDIRQLVAYIAPWARFSGRRAFTVALACYMEHFAAVEEDDEVQVTEVQVTKELYPPVARELKKKPRTAQRAIYRAVECIWEEGKNEALNRVIDRALPVKPKPGELLFYCVYYLEKGSPHFGKDFAVRS